MSLDANKIIELYKKGLVDGSVDTMEPLLSLFMLDNKPMSLKGREPMLPLFKLERPKRMTLQAGRQVSKSMNIGTLAILGSGFSGMQVAIFEPRFVQKRAINTQILSPLLRNCAVSDKLIRPNNIDTMDVKKMLSGGNIFIVNAVLTGDQARGLSGVGLCMIDECLRRDTDVFVYDFELGGWVNKKIFEIKAGDILKSFSDGAILNSVVARDASYRGCRPCYKVTTLSGRELICTSNHLLPTNKGKQRLSEVIEDVYRLHKSARKSRGDEETRGDCANGKLLNNPVECDYGNVDGGRVCIPTYNGDSGSTDAMESKLETTRVQFAQIPAITRARYERTCEEDESRIRRLLVDIDSKLFTDFALVVRDNPPQQLQTEKDYSGAIIYDNSPHSAGLVVYGRRVESGRDELWTNSNQFVYAGGESTDPELVGESVGSTCEHTQSSSQQYRQRGVYPILSEESVSAVIRTDIGICPGLHEVQSGDRYNELRSVQLNNGQISTQILLSSLRADISADAQERVDRGAALTEKREISTVEGSKSREGEGNCESLLFEHVSGAARESSAESQGLSREKPGHNKPEEAGVAGCTQGRSCVQSQESCRGPSLSRAAEARPRAVSCPQETKSGVPTSARQNSGSSRTSNGAAENPQTEDTRESRGARPSIGERSIGRRTTQGKLERGAAGGRAREGSRKGENSQTENNGRSSESRAGSEVCTRVRQKEICSTYSRRAGSQKCSGSRAQGAKGYSRGKSTEEAWTIQGEAEAGSVTNKSADTLLIPQPAEYAYDPIVSIEYVGYDDVYDIEVVGTHNYILANGICSYNCQDMLPSNIPVLEAVADAKVDTGFRIYSGTAKTLDGALAVKFEQSSQGHWCVKCICGKYNIFAPEEQLFTVIRDEGCCCAFCGKPLNSATGGFVHKFPSRVFTHPGYHLPQVIFPFHHTPNAWKEIIYKKNNIPKTQFYNEVLGVSDSDSVRLLTKADLLAARNNVRSKEQAEGLRGHYDLVILGVDWGGGGGGESATGLAVIAKSFHNNHFETLYLRRLPTGLTPEQEASIVESIASDFRVDLIAHDYTGAGSLREALFVHAFPEWRDRMFAMTYSFKPNSELVTISQSGSRTSHVIDKTRSLLLTMSCIKHGALTVPWFEPLDDVAPQLDFLAIVEHEQKLEDVGGNQVLRKSDIYLLDKVAGVRDDAAQACNIGFIAACHTLGQYPVITYDDKFTITPEQERLLLGD